jgi:DUF4097 and DUF4098 domain-containing protein YvlB
MKKYDFLKTPACSVLCLLIAAVSCSCTLGCIPTEKYERVVKLTDAMQAGGSFEAQTHNGFINVTGADVPECNLIATITARADTAENAKMLAEAVEIKLIASGNKLTAQIEKPELVPDEYICVDLDVTVPNQTSIDITTHNGALKIENLTGRLNGTTHNGTISCKKVAGNIQLQTHNGRVSCEDASGDVKLRTHNGNAKAFYSTTAPPVCNVSIVTHNGGVSVITPPNFSAKVEASTHNGSIDTVLPMTVTGEVTKGKLTGTIGTGQGSLYLETYNGSIKIK